MFTSDEIYRPEFQPQPTHLPELASLLEDMLKLDKRLRKLEAMNGIAPPNTVKAITPENVPKVEFLNNKCSTACGYLYKELPGQGSCVLFRYSLAIDKFEAATRCPDCVSEFG